MSIQVDMSSDDVDRQIEMLKVYPEIAEKHYRPVLVKDVQVLKDMLLMGVPVRTGRAQKTLGSKVTGKGVSLQGEVGWYGKNAPFYIRMVDAGTKAHAIEGYGSKERGRTGILKFPGSSGSEAVFRKSVQHPGVSARGFTQAAWDAAGPMVTQDLAMANDAIVQELAVP
jgi:hypothetical protein